MKSPPEVTFIDVVTQKLAAARAMALLCDSYGFTVLPEYTRHAYIESLIEHIDWLDDAIAAADSEMWRDAEAPDDLNKKSPSVSQGE